MFTLRDFYHLPEIELAFEQIVLGGPGLHLIAGPDARYAPRSTTGESWLGSGRQMIFRVLWDHILAQNTQAKCIFITQDKANSRITRQFRHQVQVFLVGQRTYPDLISEAIRLRPDLLVVDQLDADNASYLLRAAQQGLWVLTQLDSILWGVQVFHHLHDLGVSQNQMTALNWVLSVQRIPQLCTSCKQLDLLEASRLAGLQGRYPDLFPLLRDGKFYHAVGCDRCGYTGRQGDLALFDVLHRDLGAPVQLDQPSQMPLDAYALQLAAQGEISLEDIQQFELRQLRYTFQLLKANEQMLAETTSAYERKLAELVAANRVLDGRTRSLFALQDLGHTLISSTDLRSLAERICWRVREICGADRSILYLSPTEEDTDDDQVEILAVGGWDQGLVSQKLPRELVILSKSQSEPQPYPYWPPGVPKPSPGAEKPALRAGIYVPLFTQSLHVGVMLVHSTQKANFTPGEIAMLRTLADQAALAIQRARLITQLWAKIAELEAAQAGLAEKERMERELELARQVQQSVLPRTFPQVRGYRFAAKNRPARQVGGDFFDVIPTDDNHFLIAIADVSDKGMPAALYMALARSLLRAEAPRFQSPGSLVESVNRLLLDLGEPNMFVTVFCGLVTCSDRRMVYARAGHDRPILLHEGAAVFLEGQGVALGILDGDDFRWSEEEVSFASDDRLILYTDGLTDLPTPNGQLLESEGLRVLVESCASSTLSEMCATIFSTLADYQGENDQYDDMTLLVMGVD